MEKREFVTIDGMPVELHGERNLLEVIRRVGIKLPTFCYHSDLSIHGACRMCMVENERGGLEAACSTIPKDGMVIRTNTERLRKYRKNILELLLANHCRDCTTCLNNGKCKLQDLAMRYNITTIRYPNTAPEPIPDDSSVSISRDAAKCVLCGDCVRMCNEIQHVGAIDFAFRGSKAYISTAFGIPLSESPCVGCGQCAAVCPTGAIVVKNDSRRVWEALDNPNVKVIAQIAPAVRVALGKELRMGEGENGMGRLVTALRRMGFDEVYDTSTGADFTVLEEAGEFLDRLSTNPDMPLFTSCCPAWVNYCEKNHPDLMQHVSTCKSPMQMLAAIIKEQHKNNRKKCFHVAIMPCTAKKYECSREEFVRDGQPDVDVVITTQEIVQMIKESGIMFAELPSESVDMPLSSASGSGMIFGVTGGVTEAVLRRVSNDKTSTATEAIAYRGVRGLDGVKETTIPYGDKELSIAIVSGLGNAEKLIQSIKNGEANYDFVEVMACPGGCIAGAGQPFSMWSDKEKRGKGLYEADISANIKRSEENPLVVPTYNGVLKGRVHELLHVHYSTGEVTHD